MMPTAEIRCTLATITCYCAVSLHAQDTVVPRPPDARLQQSIAPLLEDHAGEVAVAIEHLETGDFFRSSADRVMPTASLIKFPLLIAVYHAAERGEVDLGQPITLRESDKVPGSGVLTEHVSAGATLPLRDYVRLMIRYSDNTATNIVIDQVGLNATARLMESLGCENTKLHAKVYRRDTSIFPRRSERYGLGSTTAGEMVRLLARLHRGQLASQRVTTEITDHLLACDDQSKLAASLPSGTRIAHKSGALANCRTDAGIIYTQSGPVAVCVLTNRNEDQRWVDENAANRLCARVGGAIIDRFGNPETDAPMRRGAVGRLVQSLQRTLNRRLDPSPGLAIDGDFGPATEAAVERFQRAHDLTQNGVVGSETWKALGDLVEQDDPVPSPAQIAAEVLPVTPRPPLDGPPIVTCKAWVVGDSSGNLLWESNSETPLEAASTTKVMTAYVVLQLAESKSGILDEVVTFSSRADRTIGSTCGLCAGESIRVRQLLYGLLLPSGNDAAVALAEHFGSRLRTGSATAGTDYDAFVAAMNDAAAELGLSKAHYVNPHGLSNAQHVISARDLLRLTVAARKHELFRRIVGTRQYGCRVNGREGYARNVLWKNTNRLLAIDGYGGVKTGTTSAAGACLVSCGQHGGNERIAVVLGSSSSDGRYADTRNLLRWAWQIGSQDSSH